MRPHVLQFRNSHETELSGSVVTAAALLRSRGFALCKPDPAEKKPTYRGWPACSLEPGDFSEGDQVGILGGPLSDGNRPGHALVLIDLDAEEAVRLADDYLPGTGMAEGRPGKPRSHRYYLVPVATIPMGAVSNADQGAKAAKEKTGHAGPFTKSFRHRDTNGEVLKFIGTGGQAVCPPATWTSKDGTRTERREWEGGTPGDPAVVDFLELWRAAAGLAVACGGEVPSVGGTTLTVRAKPPSSVEERAIAYLRKCDGAVSGQGGHDALFEAARAVVWGFDLGPDEGFRLLEEHYNPKCAPPWPEHALRHKCAEADTVPFQKPRGYLRDSPLPEKAKKPAPKRKDRRGGAGSGEETTPNPNDPGRVTPFDDTDLANGRRFVSDHAETVRYVADWGQWVVYDGRRWEVDRSGTAAERLAKETIDRMAREAAVRVGELANAVANAGEDQGFKAALKKAQAALFHAKKSADMRSVGRMLHAARSEPAVCVSKGKDVFDTRRDLLNCPNGTVELRTGTLRPHRPDDFITKLCPTAFDPEAPGDAYLAFLNTIFDGNPAVAGYARLLSGYVCTGEVTDQTLNIFNGDGSNGKNVLVDTWKAVLGECEYAHTAPAELLVGEGFERHPTEKTGLRGARLVVCSESGEDGLLDETKMKNLTGGDTVTARFMRGDFFQFEPTHKLILLTNNRPRVRGTDHGVWRRIRLVPFAVRFWKDADRELDPHGDYPERFRADPTLGERLRTREAGGVLADMVRHAAEVYRAGGVLTPPAEVTLATADYQSDQDMIGQFFAARVREDSEGRVKAAELYKAFVAWWGEEGQPSNKAPGSRKFGIATKRKFHRVKSSSATYAVRLLTGPEREDGRMGGTFPVDPRACACDSDFYRDHPPILPSSREDPDDLGERAAIAEFGGG